MKWSISWLFIYASNNQFLGFFFICIKSHNPSSPPLDWLSKFKGIVREETISTMAATEQEGNTCEALLFYPQLEEGGGRTLSHSNFHPTQWLSPLKHPRMQKKKKKTNKEMWSWNHPCSFQVFWRESTVSSSTCFLGLKVLNATLQISSAS